ncbi:MAG: bifunctional metallophosphatase/5'-nucleotidase [Tissierella sp.]|uniref:bifunctional metallophosphatase/5'-nucleotidase n=1 Tax=Tissierella sp. TaxID=41274 RepID=UPI003F9C696A
MKKIFRILLLSLIISLLVFPSLAKDNADDLTIVFTHDMHDNLEPYNMVIDGDIESRGGFARLSSAIAKERDKDSDLLLVDAGDYSMGTLYQTIYETHSPALRLMGKMEYDATTLGNHEFDFRPEGLSKSLISAMDSGDNLPQIVASNTKFPKEGMSQTLEELETSLEKYGVKDYLVLDKKGIKIGLIGLMGEEADSNAPMAEVEFTDIVEESKALVKTLKEDENVDLIVALSHSGTDGKPGKTEDEILAKKVPDIDLIISGHSHTMLPQPIIVGDTIIVSSGRYAENLGKIKIEKNEDKWNLKDYQIKTIDETYKEDKEISSLIDGFKEDVENEYLDRFGLKYDEVIAESPFNFTPALDLAEIQEEEPLGYLIGDAYRYAVKKAEGDDYKHVDVAVVPSGVIRDSFTKGHITVKDIFKVSSLGIGRDKLSGYPLIDVYLTGKELKTAAEVDASIQPLMNSAQLYLSGMRYSFNPHRIIFNKITDTSIFTSDGKQTHLEDDKLYRVVANLYSAQMLNIVGDKSMGLLSIVPKDENGDKIDDFEERIIYENGEEVKEWVALTSYLQSFPKEDGIPQIPKSYSKKQGVKIINDDTGLVERFKNPNKISLGIVLIPLVLILIIILVIRFFIKRKRKKTRV